MLTVNSELLHDYDEVFDFVVSKAKVITETEILSLTQLSDRVLAEEVISPLNLPSHSISAMDGYGFSTKAIKEWLPVVKTVFAGRPTEGISSRKSVRIMTGAMIPEGVDCVIPQENAFVQQGDTEPLLRNPDGDEAVKSGQHIKMIGSDVKKGESLLEKGHLIRSQDIALLASVGLSQASVYKKVKVVVLVSGDELASPGEPLNPGQIYDANSWLIGDLIKQLPAELLAVETLPDKAEKIKETMLKWDQQADLLITIGGASVGQKDHVKTVLTSLKKFWSWKLNMKPAKPFSMAQLSHSTLVALPGNPLAAFMSFQLFAKSLIQKSAGLVSWQNRPLILPLLDGYAVHGNKTQWLQVKRVAMGLQPIENGSSSQLSKLVEASGYIRIHPDKTYPKACLVEFWAY
ncbi:MAG: molybdopterin molybdotransferase MoeA [Pseudomonadota bacterium]|nr:molybdopterin molybdotransferase MoeA [Pseudomonadota bacterium]